MNPRTWVPYGSTWVELPEPPVEEERDDAADLAVLEQWIEEDLERHGMTGHDPGDEHDGGAPCSGS